MSTPRRLTVRLGERSYDVWVGTGLLERAHELLPDPRPEVVAVVTDAVVGGLHLDRLARGLEPLAARVESFTIEPGERSKGIATAGALWRWMAAMDFHRGDLVVALGGGVVGDLGGFAAATYHRGVGIVQAPTTVLAQVDAAIGGKTAIDLPEGKNLVGAFHQPRAVIADTSTLATLSEPVFATGLSEIVKHALIADEGLRAFLHAWRDPILRREPDVLTDLVARSAALKVEIVSRDETERGERAHLNYGHTLGHALEVLGDYRRFTHGEAVSIGMMFAAHLARELGYADRTCEHRQTLDSFGLPCAGAGFSFEEVAGAWQRDKKYARGMRFVVLEDFGKPTLVGDVPEAALRRAYEAVRS